MQMRIGAERINMLLQMFFRWYAHDLRSKAFTWRVCTCRMVALWKWGWEAGEDACWWLQHGSAELFSFEFGVQYTSWTQVSSALIQACLVRKRACGNALNAQENIKQVCSQYAPCWTVSCGGWIDRHV